MASLQQRIIESSASGNNMIFSMTSTCSQLLGFSRLLLITLGTLMVTSSGQAAHKGNIPSLSAMEPSHSRVFSLSHALARRAVDEMETLQKIFPRQERE